MPQSLDRLILPGYDSGIFSSPLELVLAATRQLSF